MPGRRTATGRGAGRSGAMRIIPATGWVGDNDPDSPAAERARKELADSAAPLDDVHAHEGRVSKTAPHGYFPHGKAGCGDDGPPDNAAPSKPVLIFVCDTTGTRTVHLQDGARLAELYAVAKGYNTGEVTLRFLGGAPLPRDAQLTLAGCHIRSNTCVEVVGRLLGGVEVTLFGRQHTIDDAGGLDLRDMRIGPAEIKEVAAFLMTPAGAVVASLRCGDNPGIVGKLNDYGEVETPDVHAEVFKELTDSLKTSQVTEADFSACGIGPVALGHLSDWVREATAAVTSINCLANQFREDDLATLLTAIEGTSVRSLCGLTERQTTADFSVQDLRPIDMKIMAAEYRFQGFIAVVNSVTVNKNPIGFPSGTSVKPGAVTGVAAKKGVFAAVDGRFGEVDGLFGEVTQDPYNDSEVKLRWLDDGSEAYAIKTDKLTSVVASRNDLVEDYSHIRSLGEALSGSKVHTCGLANCNFNPATMTTFVESVRWAEAVVTSMNCLNNPLGEGVHTITKVFEETPRLRTLCGLEEGVEHIDWSNSEKGPADVALLAAELKAGRAVAALTSINCSRNDAITGKRSRDNDGWNWIYGEQLEGWTTLCSSLRGSSITSLNFSGCQLGPEALIPLADAIKFMGAMTWMNCLNNPLGEGVHTITKVFEETPRLRTLCGLEEGVEHINWSNSEKGPADVALLAAELKAGRAAAVLNSLTLDSNSIFGLNPLDRLGHQKATPDKLVDDCDAFLAGLKESNILTLSLQQTGIGPLALRKLATSLPTVLNALTLDSNGIFGELPNRRGDGTKPDKFAADCDAFFVALKDSSITTLSLRNTGIGPVALRTLATSLPTTLTSVASTTIARLILDKNPLTGGRRSTDFDTDITGITALCDTVKTSSVLELGLANCRLGPGSVGKLAEYVREAKAVAVRLVLKGARFGPTYESGPTYETGTGTYITLSTCRQRTTASMASDPCGDLEEGATFKVLATTTLEDSTVRLQTESGWLSRKDHLVRDMSLPCTFQVLCDALKPSKVTEVDFSCCGLGPRAIEILSGYVHDATTALNLLTLSSTGDEYDPKTYTLTAGEDKLELNDKNLGPADVVLISVWLATNAGATIARLILDKNPLTGGRRSTDFDTDMTGITDLCDTLKTSSVTELGLAKCRLGPGSVGKLAEYVREAEAVLTCINCLANQFGEDDLATLLAAIEGTSVRSLCGLTERQTTTEFSGQNLGPIDTKIMAAEYGFQGFIAMLNSVTVDSTGSRKLVRGDASQEQVDASGSRTYTLTVGEEKIDLTKKNLGSADVALVATWLQLPEVSVVVTSINCLANKLGEEDLATFRTAIEGTSVRSLCGLTEGQTVADFSGQNLGPIDCKIMAAEYGFQGFIAVVTSMNVSGNKLGGDGGAALWQAIAASTTLTSVLHEKTEISSEDATAIARWTQINRDGVTSLLTNGDVSDLGYWAAKHAHPILQDALESMGEDQMLSFLDHGNENHQSVAMLLAKSGGLRGLRAIARAPDIDLKSYRLHNNASAPTVLEIARASESKEMQAWARQYGTFLGRYSVQSGPAVHDSGTSLVRYARDEMHGTSVALKSMKHKDQFQAEIRSRFVDKRVLSKENVIQALGWHTPHGETLIAKDGRHEEAESTNADADSGYSYVVVLERGERSLHDACAKERICGHNVHEIIVVMRAVASCVGYLHNNGRIHGDLKQRNILRVIDGSGVRWCLCDMDASVKLGCAAGKKTSSAYSPPELAQEKYGRGGSTIASASPSFDVWSFGVVLYEMCSGRTLFAQDINNDELISTMDRVRLCTWHTITDEELEPVFKHVANAETLVEDAKNLIRWCLQGDSSRRPTIAQVLEHRFLSGTGDVPTPPFLPMRYHGFLSHSQADASGTVGKLYFEYAQLGLHCWLDMKQANLTLEGMRQGVRDSQVFLLVLSERVLGSWFCQQELLCAIAEEKPIQLILEEELRFHPFAASHWRHQQESEVEPRTILVETASGKAEEVVAVSMDENDSWQKEQGDKKLTRLLYETIDHHLPNAVVFRRRDFEVEAMMRELCQRNGVVLPVLPYRPWPVGTPLKKVFVICNLDSAADIVRALTDAVAQHAKDRVILLREPTDLAKADKVLLVLTHGVLSGDSLSQLKDTIRQDTQRQDTQRQDRVVAVYSEEFGWSFGCEEQEGASPEVRACIDNHEAIVYRDRKDGSAQYEFMAMFNHLLTQLGAGPATLRSARHDVPALVPLSGVRDRLDEKERRLAQHEKQAARALDAGLQALAAEKDAQLQALEAKHAEKDAQLQALATKKDAQLQALAAEKDAEKDAQLQALAAKKDAEKDAQLQALAAEKDAQLQALAAEKDVEKDAQLQALAAEKDAQLQALTDKVQELQAQLAANAK